MPYKDPEKRKQHSKQYYLKNREKILSYITEYQKTHKEERKAIDARYRKTDKCKATHKRYNDSQKGKTTHNKYSKHYRKRNYVRQSYSEKHNNPDFSPLQNGEFNLSISETTKYIHTRATAKPKAQNNNNTSSRKGVSYDKNRCMWAGYLKINGVYYRQYFYTEQEAIQYRKHLEDTYYSSEQLRIRDKYISEI